MADVNTPMLSTRFPILMSPATEEMLTRLDKLFSYWSQSAVRIAALAMPTELVELLELDELD